LDAFKENSAMFCESPEIIVSGLDPSRKKFLCSRISCKLESLLSQSDLFKEAKCFLGFAEY
ncbi:11036_t:CDS:1, partial [Funneliformis caledonium]